MTDLTYARLPRVTATERDVLVLARAVVLGGSYASVESVMRDQAKCDGLGPAAMRLFEETLAKGCVRSLARLGGFRRMPRVAPDRSVESGRLWELHPTFELVFSPFAFELFRWLVSQPLGKANTTKLKRVPTTSGDELLAYLACAFVEGQVLEQVVAAQPAIRASALAWLGFPTMLATAGGADGKPRFDLLAADVVVLEALQDDLARRAVAFERARALVTAPAELKRLGESRAATLTPLLDALASARRLDLATFLVDAGAVLLPSNVDAKTLASRLVARLDSTATLRDRAEARRAAGAHLRALGRLGAHQNEAREVRFFEEGYAVAQLVLARWEHLGNDGFSRAAEVLVELDALDRG